MIAPASLPFHFHPEAEREYVAAIAWGLDHDARWASRLESAVNHAIARICRLPASGSPYLHGTRRVVLHKLPYSVVYREANQAIQVLAIAHAKRRPGYWRERM